MTTPTSGLSSISHALLRSQQEVIHAYAQGSPLTSHDLDAQPPEDNGGVQSNESHWAPVEMGRFSAETFFGNLPGTMPMESTSALIAGREPKPVDVTLMQLCMDIGHVPGAGSEELNGYTRSNVLTTTEPLPEGAWMDESGIVHGPNGETWIVLTEEDGWTTDADGTVHGPDNATIDENGIIHGPDGLEAAIYVNEYGDIVVVFAGTGDAADVKTDVQHGRGVVTGQHEFAMDLAVSLEERYPGRVIFTGHSLGGGLASTASLATGAPAITFNAAGVNEATREEATRRRNSLEERMNGELDYQEKTTEEYVQEANAGNVRHYYVEGEIVDALNGLPLTPDAIGAPIEIEDADDSLIEMKNNPVVDVLLTYGASKDTRVMLLKIVLDLTEMVGDHMMGTVAEAMLSEDGMVVSTTDGTSVMQASRDPSTDEFVFTTVQFEDTPEGRRAQRTYEMTGELPDDMSGVQSASSVRLAIGTSITDVAYGYTEVTFANTPEGRAAFNEFTATGGTLPSDGMLGVEAVTTIVPAPGDSEMAMSSTTQYGANGLPVSGSTQIHEDGTEVVSISHTYDVNGNEDPAQRTYTYSITPRNELDVALLQHMFPDDGPFEIGETYSVTLSESEVQALWANATEAGGPDLLPDEARNADDPEANLLFALNIATHYNQHGAINNLRLAIDHYNAYNDAPFDPAVDVEPEESTP